MPTAFFCATDYYAMRTLARLHHKGIRVPEDIAIVGFDDSPIAAKTSVPLTTMAQQSELQGWLMVDVLLRVLAGEPEVPRRTILDTKLVKRQSA